MLNFGLWSGLEKAMLGGRETRRLIRDVGRCREWHAEEGLGGSPGREVWAGIAETAAGGPWMLGCFRGSPSLPGLVTVLISLPQCRLCVNPAQEPGAPLAEQ